MGLSNRYKKRVLIFLIIPVLVSIPFFTDNLILRIIVAVLGIVYVGFIIFLRDSKNEAFKKEFQYEENDELTEDDLIPFTDDEHDSSFEIVSRNKDPEVLTADNVTDIPAIKRQSAISPLNLKKDFDKLAKEITPPDLPHEKQFGFILKRILFMVQELFFAHSVLFFWYNDSKNKLALEEYVSNSDEVEEKHLDLQDDLLSKIVRNEEPELMNDINPSAEKDVVRYYKSPPGIKSFLGVPLYYGGALTGVLALDSKEADAFGEENVISLGRFVSLIAELIKIYEQKFSESVAANKLNSLLNILSGDKKFQTKEELISTIERAVEGLIHWDAFAFVYFDPVHQKFSTAKVKNKTNLKYIGENLEVEINNTLTGKSIVSGLPIKIDDVSADDYIRYSKLESITIEGTYAAIPLIYEEQIYGVICLESLKKDSYTNEDINFLKSSFKFISFALYSFASQSLLRSLLSHDVETRAFTYETFRERVASDLLKAGETNSSGALAFVRIDDFLDEESLFEETIFPKVLKAVANLIQQEMNPLTTFGRIDQKTFAVYFFNFNVKDAYLWAERLRRTVANKQIAIQSKQTTFTISAGVCSAVGRTNIDDLLNDAELTLSKAVEKGNSVKSME
ncbi:MAG: hypothetical protein SCALA702_13730 [Melioribacteraceae bacterium]|nr:MAG: hypothetical protein SCALA702_13730 [Melioribacteraceae bacterium]